MYVLYTSRVLLHNFFDIAFEHNLFIYHKLCYFIINGSIYKYVSMLYLIMEALMHDTNFAGCQQLYMMFSV